jgi:hypothetical protein
VDDQVCDVALKVLLADLMDDGDLTEDHAGAPPEVAPNRPARIPLDANVRIMDGRAPALKGKRRGQGDGRVECERSHSRTG